ncbi:MAG: NIPSNAP family protein [Acidobacteria bacterium]|nr:NIPSNAP family protein [Acidobacteriota bacterium]
MKLLKLRLVFSLAAVSILFFAAGATAQSRSKNPIHQLRIYEIPRENREVFHERFKNHALRIMKKYGFRIVAIWESETDDKLEFVYLLEWKDKPTMEESWKKFLADEEWKEIKKKSSEKYGTFVNEIKERTLILTDYSPRKRFF